MFTVPISGISGRSSGYTSQKSERPEDLYRHTSGKYLFIEKKGKLDLPKGHIEPGEEPDACALREVSEECGISGHSIVKPLQPSYHTYSWEGISYLKKTSWFLMEYDGIMVTEPQSSEGITKVEWFSADEISKIKRVPGYR